MQTLASLPRPTYDPTNVGNKPGDGPLRAGGVSVSGIPETHAGNLPSTRSPASKRQEHAVAIVRDIWGGTESVRARSTTYLPQAPGEDSQNYQARLHRSVFFNAFRATIEGLTGFVFRKDPVLSEDVPAAVRGENGHWENIDNAGTHGDVFVRELLQDAMQAGHCAILVEYPRVEAGRVVSLADEQGPAPKVRPYWVAIKKENILSWRTQTIDGRTVLTQLVLKECTHVPDGAFGEKEQTRYRVFVRTDDGRVGFHLLEITQNNAVVEVDSGLYANQTEIPVAEIVTSGKKGLFDSDPPLIDLAFLNIAHYQQASDYATSLHMTCVPILTIIGADTVGDTGQKVVVGPNTVLTLPGVPGADAKYVSHDGAALGSVKAALDDLKSDMGVLGLSMLSPQKRTAETAEAKRIDKGVVDSKLGVTARGLQDGVERALQFHANYLPGKPSGGSIVINRDFDDMSMPADLMQAWAQLATALHLPVRVVLEALQDGGRLPPDADLDELEAEIATNAAAAEAQKEAEQAARMEEMQTRVPTKEAA